jgi:hypothetical protein
VEAAGRPKPTALPREGLLPPWKRVGRATLPQTPIVLRIETLRSPGQIQAKLPEICSGSARGNRLPPKAYGVASGTSATPLETRGESHTAPNPYRTAHRNHAVARPKSQGATNLFKEPPECHTFCPTPIVLHIDCMKNHNQSVVDLHQQNVAKRTLWPTPIVLRIEQLSAPKP